MASFLKIKVFLLGPLVVNFEVVLSLKFLLMHQSKCREGSTMTVSLHQNFKLNIRIDVCTDFKQLLKN